MPGANARGLAVSAAAARGRTGLSVATARGLEATRERPRHAALALLVVALAAGPHVSGGVLLAAAVAAAVLASAVKPGARALGALLAAALLLTGALVGGARAAALERSALAPALNHAVREHVVVHDAPRPDAYGGWSSVVRLGEDPVLLLGRGPRPDVAIGDGLHVRGVLEPPGTWAGRLRMHAELRATSVRPSGRRRTGPAGALDNVRRRAQRALDQQLPAAQAGLLRGMVLGDDSALPAEVRDDFRASGLSHLVAASGTNVMLLATLAIALAMAAGLERTGRLVLALGLIVLYVPLAGGGPSIQRAGIMGAAILVAALAGRPGSRWYALGLAAGGTLALDPRAVTALGWQLSFAAVVGILALAPRWREALRRRGAPGALADAVAVTIAASLATAPVLAATLGEVSPVSLVANVLAAPAVAPVMWLGFLAAAAGQVSTAPAAVLDAMAGLPLGYLTWLAGAAARVPWAVVPAGPLAVTGVCVAVAAVLTSRRVRRVAPAVAVVAVAGGVALAPARAAPAGPPSGLRMTVLDVGQGDAVLLQEPGHAVLVDTGPPDGEVVDRLREGRAASLDGARGHSPASSGTTRAAPADVLGEGSSWGCSVDGSAGWSGQRAGGRGGFGGTVG
jgi:competence protein ComEC